MELALRRSAPEVARLPANVPRRRGLRDLGSCRRGVVALEFALVATPLMLLVFGFIAVSAVFNSWSSMQGNAQYAARMMSTGQIASWNSTATACSPLPASTKVEYYACKGLPGWTSFTATVSEDCTVPSVTVKLSANTKGAAIVDIANIFGSTATISAQAVVMKEGSCP
jgi:Flp pilus assembly protein TadG